MLLNQAQIHSEYTNMGQTKGGQHATHTSNLLLTLADTKRQLNALGVETHEWTARAIVANMLDDDTLKFTRQAST